MPQNAPGSLSGQQNADILAFMFSANKFPAGDDRTAQGSGHPEDRSSSKSRNPRPRPIPPRYRKMERRRRALHFFVRSSPIAQIITNVRQSRCNPRQSPLESPHSRSLSSRVLSSNIGGTYEIPSCAHAWSVASRGHRGFGVRAGIPGRPARVASRTPAASFPASKSRSPTSRPTSSGRSVTNERGEYVFANVDPGNYAVKASAAGLQDGRSRRHPHRHAAVPHARPDDGGRRDRRERHGHRRRRRSSTRRTRRPARCSTRRRCRRCPSPGRNAFMIGAIGADRHPVGRRAVQPPAGSDQRLADVARRRHAARQQLHARRRADHRPAQPRCRATRRSKRSTTSRCRCTPTTRRWAAPAAACSTRRCEVGHQQLPRHRLLSRRARSGAQTNNYFSRARRGGRAEAARSRSPYLPRRRRLRRPDHQEPHVLLVRERELHTTCRRATAGDACRPRRSAPATSRGRPTPRASRCIIYDPLTHAAVPRQRHPGEPHQPGGGGDAEVPAAARHQRRQRQRELQPHVADQSTTSRRESTPAKVEHKFTDKVSLTGFYLYNRTERAVRRTTSARRIRPSRTALPTRSTTSWCGGRRCWR